jgi:hypothetical protein
VKWQTLQGTIISRILRIAIAWCQWHGANGNPASLSVYYKTPRHPYRIYPISAKLKLHQPFITEPERTTDIYIMEYVIRSKAFPEDDIKIINYCRQHLHVTTISDLLDASGKKLLPHIIQCRRPPWNDPEQYIILQHRPSLYQIRHKWRKFLREISNNDHTPKPFLTFDGPIYIMMSILRRLSCLQV